MAVTVLMFLIHPGAGVVALLAGAGVLGALYYLRKSKADAAVQKIEETRVMALEESVRMYRAARAEFFDAGLVYQDLDAQESKLLDTARAWTAGNRYSTKEAA